MNIITAIDPDEFLKNSQATLFQIILVTSKGEYFFRGNGFESTEHPGFINLKLFERDILVKAYNEAFKYAKHHFNTTRPGHDKPIEGQLNIVEL